MSGNGIGTICGWNGLLQRWAWRGSQYGTPAFCPYYDTPHGIANAVLLPYVMEFNKNYTGEKYREIARAMG